MQIQFINEMGLPKEFNGHRWNSSIGDNPRRKELPEFLRSDLPARNLQKIRDRFVQLEGGMQVPDKNYFNQYIRQHFVKNILNKSPQSLSPKKKQKDPFSFKLDKRNIVSEIRYLKIISDLNSPLMINNIDQLEWIGETEKETNQLKDLKKELEQIRNDTPKPYQRKDRFFENSSEQNIAETIFKVGEKKSEGNINKRTFYSTSKNQSGLNNLGSKNDSMEQRSQFLSQDITEQDFQIPSRRSNYREMNHTNNRNSGFRITPIQLRNLDIDPNQTAMLFSNYGSPISRDQKNGSKNKLIQKQVSPPLTNTHREGVGSDQILETKMSNYANQPGFGSDGGSIIENEQQSVNYSSLLIEERSKQSERRIAFSPDSSILSQRNIETKELKPPESRESTQKKRSVKSYENQIRRLTFYNQLNHIPLVVEDQQMKVDQLIDIFDDVKNYKSNQSTLDQTEVKKMEKLLGQINEDLLQKHTRKQQTFNMMQLHLLKMGIIKQKNKDNFLQ